MCRISTKEKYNEAIALMEQYQYQDTKTPRGDFESGYSLNYLFQKTPKGIAVYDLNCFKTLIDVELHRNLDLKNINPQQPRFQFNFHGFQYLCEYFPFDEFYNFISLDKWTFLRFEEQSLTPKDVVLEEHVFDMIEKDKDPIFALDEKTHNHIKYAIISKKNPDSSYDFVVLELEKELIPPINVILDQQISHARKVSEQKNLYSMYDERIIFLDMDFLVRYIYKNNKPFACDVFCILSSQK